MSESTSAHGQDHSHRARGHKGGHTLGQSTEDVPCSPPILVLCCCHQQPAFSVSPGHLTIKINTNRILLEVQRELGKPWGRGRSQDFNCFSGMLTCELGTFSTLSSCIKPVRMSFPLKACYVKTL